MYAGSLGNTICVMGMVASLALRVILMLIYWYKFTIFVISGQMAAMGLITKIAFFLYSFFLYKNPLSSNKFHSVAIT